MTRAERGGVDVRDDGVLDAAQVRVDVPLGAIPAKTGSPPAEVTFRRESPRSSTPAIQCLPSISMSSRSLASARVVVVKRSVPVER